MIRFSHMTNNLPDDQDQTKTNNPTSSRTTLNKEKGGWGPVEKEPGLAEYKEPEIPKETEGWLEKLEKGEDIQLPQPVTDDDDQVILDNAEPKVDKVELPLTKQETEKGLHYKVWDSIRWLAEWCVKMAKTNPNKFNYQKEHAE